MHFLGAGDVQGWQQVGWRGRHGGGRRPMNPLATRPGAAVDADLARCPHIQHRRNADQSGIGDVGTGSNEADGAPGDDRQIETGAVDYKSHSPGRCLDRRPCAVQLPAGPQEGTCARNRERQHPRIVDAPGRRAQGRDRRIAGLDRGRGDIQSQVANDRHQAAGQVQRRTGDLQLVGGADVHVHQLVTAVVGGTGSRPVEQLAVGAGGRIHLDRARHLQIHAVHPDQAGIGHGRHHSYIGDSAGVQEVQGQRSTVRGETDRVGQQVVGRVGVRLSGDDAGLGLVQPGTGSQEKGCARQRYRQRVGGKRRDRTVVHRQAAEPQIDRSNGDQCTKSVHGGRTFNPFQCALLALKIQHRACCRGDGNPGYAVAGAVEEVKHPIRIGSVAGLVELHPKCRKLQDQVTGTRQGRRAAGSPQRGVGDIRRTRAVREKQQAHIDADQIKPQRVRCTRWTVAHKCVDAGGAEQQVVDAREVGTIRTLQIAVDGQEIEVAAEVEKVEKRDRQVAGARPVIQSAGDSFTRLDHETVLGTATGQALNIAKSDTRTRVTQAARIDAREVPDVVDVGTDQRDQGQRIADDVGDAAQVAAVIGSRTGDVDRAIGVDGDGDHAAVVGRVGQDQVGRRHRSGSDRCAACGHGCDGPVEPDTLPGRQAGRHHRQRGIVVETENVADLVHQNGEQVDATCRRACGIRSQATIAQIQRKFGTVGRGRVDEPATPGSVGVQRDGGAAGKAQLPAGQVGDVDLEAGQAVGQRAREACGRPESFRLRKHRREGGGCQGPICRRSARKRKTRGAEIQRLLGSRRLRRVREGR